MLLPLLGLPEGTIWNLLSCPFYPWVGQEGKENHYFTKKEMPNMYMLEKLR